MNTEMKYGPHTPEVEALLERARALSDVTNWRAPMQDRTMPVPPETVAVLRLPVLIDGFVATTRALEDAYGPRLVIRTDAGIAGWMVVAVATTDAADGEH